MNKTLRTLPAIIAAAGLLALGGCATQPQNANVKAAYHVNGDLDTASAALRNIRNHLEADPKAKIAVVTHSKGIDFLLDGAKDKNGNVFANMVDDLALRGVEFKVCNNTLVSRKIDKSKVISAAVIVPSGVSEIARLQAQDGYVYVKP